MIFFQTRFKIISFFVMMMGVGTFLLHGTLRFYGQWIDELAMLMLSFFIIKELRSRDHKQTDNNLCYIILLFYFLFNHKYAFFVSLFFCMQCYIYKLTKIRKQSRRRTRKCLRNSYAILFIFSTCCWLLDQFFCNYTKAYQLHAVWHVGTALALGVGFTGLII